MNVFPDSSNAGLRFERVNVAVALDDRADGHKDHDLGIDPAVAAVQRLLQKVQVNRLVLSLFREEAEPEVNEK